MLMRMGRLPMGKVKALVPVSLPTVRCVEVLGRAGPRHGVQVSSHAMHCMA